MKYGPQPWWMIAQKTSPICPPAISVWSLVKYSALGKLSILVLIPVFCSNSGSRSFSVSASLPVRTCSRISAVDLTAGWAGAAAAAVVGCAAAAGAAGFTASAGLLSAGFAASAGFAGSAGLAGGGALLPQAATNGATAAPRAATLRLRTTMRRLNRRGCPTSDDILVLLTSSPGVLHGRWPRCLAGVP